MKTYSQCRLRRKSTEQVAWIPTNYAVVGMVVRITENNFTEDGWEIISCGQPVDRKFIEEHERDYMRQRRVSDI